MAVLFMPVVMVAGLFASCHLPGALPFWIFLADHFLPLLLSGLGLVLLIGWARWFLRRRPGNPGQSNKPSTRADFAWLCLFAGLAALCGATPVIDAELGGQDPEAHRLLRVFPVSDAEVYLIGASRLLIDGELDDWNSRRPLNAPFLASLIGAGGGDYERALAGRAVFQALAATLAALAIAASFGTLPTVGVLLLAGLLSHFYSASPLSFSLGISLGLLAVGASVEGMRRRSPGILAFGLFLFTLGLLARAGAFFVLPAMVAGGALVLARQEGTFRWRRLFVSALVLGGGVVAGFVVNFGVVAVHGGNPGNVNGNFAHTLYGIARGGEDWQHIYRDHPEGRGAPGSAENRFILRKALESIEEEPGLFLKGLVRRVGEVEHFGNFGKELLRGTGFSGGGSWVGWVIFGLVVAGLIRMGRIDGGAAVFWSFSLAGLLLSLPIITDGGFRVKAATLPIPALLLAAAVFPWKPGSRGAISSGWMGASGGFTAVFLAMVLVGPQLYRLGPDRKFASEFQADTMVFRPGLAPVALAYPEEGDRNVGWLPFLPREQVESYLDAEISRRSYMPAIREELNNGSVIAQYWTGKGRGWRILLALPREQWNEMRTLPPEVIVRLPAAWQLDNR